MNELRPISEAEWEVMEVLWQESPLTPAEVAERLQGRKNWSDNTVRTLLERLYKKEALWKLGLSGKVRYQSRVAKEEQVRFEVENFTARVFAGRTSALLLLLAREVKLSLMEKDELRALLDRDG